MCLFPDRQTGKQAKQAKQTHHRPQPAKSWTLNRAMPLIAATADSKHPALLSLPLTPS